MVNIDFSGNGFGVIRTTEVTEERRAYLRRLARERYDREHTKGHVFTRRTYRAARRRAISRMLEARDVWDIAIPDTPARRLLRVEYLIARHLARGIVARARREKGMWT